jgi:hypothetical protein
MSRPRGPHPKGKMLFCDPRFHAKLKVEAYKNGMPLTSYTRLLAKDPRPISEILKGKDKDKKRGFDYGF